jgi:outer membrane protein insertion porin family
MQIDRNAPLKISSTTIVGNVLTRQDTIERRLQNLYEAKTVQEVAQASLEGSKRLEQLGIFDSIELELLPSKNGKLGEASLLVKVKEKRVVSLRATTFVEQGEGGVELAMKATNALGTAESLEISGLMGGAELKGTPRKSQVRADYSQPTLAGLPLSLLISADSSSHRPLGDSCYEDVSYGVGVKIKSQLGLDFEWAARQRDVYPTRLALDANESSISSQPVNGVFSYSAPPEIITSARPSLKSALVMQFARDYQAPNSQCPREGSAGLLRMEVALPKVTGGNVGLFSLTGKIRRVFPLLPELSLVTSMEAGVARSLGSDPFIHLQDRLYLGGPLYLRGFHPRGAGPRSQDGTASLGGSNRWQCRVGLEGPPPSWSILPSSSRAHLFVACGALSNELSAQSLLKQDVRASVGCGVAFGIAFGRLEVNCVYAVKSEKNDSVSGRLQFGIGAEFL